MITETESAVQITTVNTKDTNGFITGFINPQETQLSNLKQVSDELAEEKLRWQFSGATETMVKGLSDKLDEAGYPNRLNDPKIFQSTVAGYNFDMYATTSYSAGANHALANYWKGLPPKAVLAYKEFEQTVIERSKDFQNAVRPLTQQRDINLEELLTSWQDYMTESPSSYVAFSEFLDLEITEQDEKTRPFLEALQHRESFLTNTYKKLVERMLALEDPNTLVQFLTKHFLTSKKDSNTNDWLVLLSHQNGGIIPEIVVNCILEAHLLPRDLVQPYQNYLNTLIFPLASRVKQQLEVYRIERPKLNLGIVSKNVKTPNGKKITTHLRASVQGIPTEIPKKPQYKMVVIKRDEPVELSSEYRQTFIQETARGFSQTEYMKEVIGAILNGLQEDPWGLGVGKLTDLTTSSISPNSEKPVPLRRFRADKRPGLLPSNSQELQVAQDIRAVFHFDPKALPNTIILDEIVEHDVFDKKYTS